MGKNEKAIWSYNDFYTENIFFIKELGQEVFMYTNNAQGLMCEKEVKVSEQFNNYWSRNPSWMFSQSCKGQEVEYWLYSGWFSQACCVLSVTFKTP